MSVLAGAASAEAAITITSPGNESYTNNLRPAVAFTGATPGGEVTLAVSGSDAVGTADADINGEGSVTPSSDITGTPMDENNRRFGITLLDSEGAGPNQATFVLRIDQVPSISTSEDAQLAADAWVYVSDAIPDEGVNLYVDGVWNKAVTADDNGTVGNITPNGTLTAGAHTAYVTSVDADENESSHSETVNFDVAPASPDYAALSAFNVAQLNQGQSDIDVDGIAPGATKVSLYDYDFDANEWQRIDDTTTIVDDTATLTPTVGLTDGSHMLAITQTVNGVEGLTDADGATVNIDVLTTAPVLDTSFDGTLTNDNTPYFYATGTLKNYGDNHTFARLYVDGVRVGQSDPDYTFEGESGAQADDPIADGPHSAYMVTVDDLGHESVTHSNSVAFTVDTVGPAAPTVVSPANGSTTATSLPMLTVTAEPGSVAHVLVDDVGEESYETVDANGNVTFTLTQALADGVHTLHVFSRDGAGNYGDFTTTTFTVLTAKAPPAPPAPPVTPTTPTTPTNPTDLDGDGITNNWLVGGKAAPAPATPKAKVSSDKVELKLTTAPKGATKIRVYRADGKGAYTLVKTVTAKTKSFTDKKVKAGHTYKYKTVGVNAKGQQGKASGTATAKVKKKK